MARLAKALPLLLSLSTAAQMRVVQRATAYTPSAPITVTFGTPPTMGDVLVASIGYYTPDFITPPAGWTLIRQQYGNGEHGTTAYISFYHVVAFGEAPSYTFTGEGHSASIAIYDVTGADIYHPINAVASSSQEVQTASVTTPSATPTVAGALALSSVSSEASQITGVSSPGWTYFGPFSNSHAIADAYISPLQDNSPVSTTFSLSAADTYGMTSTTIILSPAGTTGHVPVANPGGPYAGIEGLAINFDGSASSDPRSEPLAYSWNFGDGSVGSGSVPVHMYSTPGTYTVTLLVTNTDGYTATATAIARVGMSCSAVTLGDYGALNGFVPSPTDAWHTDISTAPVDALSNTILVTNAADLAGSYLHPDFGGNGAYGIPYTVVDSAPGVQVNVTEYPGESDLTLFPIPSNMPVESSPADCSTNGDNHAIVFDRKSCVAYEMYHTQRCSSSPIKWNAGSTAVWDFTQNELRPLGFTSVDAAGLSVFEGLVRYDEIQAGAVNHAIRFTAKFTKNNANGGYFTPPATHAAGTLWGTDNIEGMRIRLKAGYDISGLGPQAKIIATAMKKFGMILADNGSNLYFQGTSDPRWDDDDLNGLKYIPSSAFEVIAAPLSSSYQAGTAPMYPNGPIYDSENHPTGSAPVISSFTASSSSITAGQSVTLTPTMSGSSYAYIDSVGFIRGPVTVSPASTTTYTLTSRNAYGSTSAQVTVDVVAAITPALQFTAIQDQAFGAPPFTVSASSASSGAVTYSVVSGPATIAGNIVTLTGTGAVTLQANQAADGNYLAASATASFQVTSGTPLLQFTSISDQTFGTAPFPVSASSLSNGAITYAVLSGPATIAGNIVTITGTGAVNLQASQAATGNFGAATANAGFQVRTATPSLQFAAVPDQTFGAAPFTVSATSVSSGAVTYAVLSGPATIAGNVISITGVGTVALQANQAAAGNYDVATATVNFQVRAATPALQFTPIPDQTFGAAPFTVSASSASNGAVTYAALSGPATMAGNVITVTGAGSVTLQASQAAAGNYDAATATISFQVRAATPSLQFASIPDQTFGASPFAISASSASNGAVTYAVLSGPATVTANTVTITGVGTVHLQANQAAAGNYDTATATTNFQVRAATPALQFSTIPDQTFGASPFAVSASSASNGAVTYAVLSGPATIAGNLITVTGAGAVQVQASQAAAGNYAAAVTTANFQVRPATPALQFSAIPDQTFGVSPFAVSASSASNGVVTYAILSGPATISGNIIAVNGTGPVTLQANQVAAGNYASATATVTFQVNAATSTLQFTAIPDKTFGDPPFTLFASSVSSGAVTYSVLSGPAIVAGNLLAMNGTGIVTVQANQAAAGNYAAMIAMASFQVRAANPVLQFAQIPDQTFGASPFPISAASASNGAISYSVLSGPAAVAGNVITLTGAGTVTLQASQTAAGNYAAATVTTSFQVRAVAPALQFASVSDQTFGASPVAVSASSQSNGTIAYAVLSGPATMAGNVVSLTGTGTVTLQASQAAAGNYAAATATTTFQVRASTPILQFSAIPDQTFGAGPLTVFASSASNGSVSYAVLSGPATLVGNVLSASATGTVTIQANQAAAGNYAAATATTTFQIRAAVPALQFASIVDQTFGAAPMLVSASSASNGAITYAVLSGPATISSNLVTSTGAGLVTLGASQAATGNYQAASATVTFQIRPATPTLQFASISDQTYGAAPLTVSASSASSGAITYAVLSGPVSIAGNVITTTGIGPVVLQASQVASGNYAAATATASFQVQAVTPMLQFASVADQTFGAAPFALSASSASTGSVTYTVLRGPATVAGNIIQLTGAGQVSVQANQAAAGNYAAATATLVFQVNAAAPALQFSSIADQTYGAAPFAVSASSASSGAVTYAVVSGPAGIAGNVMTLTGVGTITLQASQAAAGGYLAATATTTFKVSSKTPALQIAAIPDQTYGAAPFAITASSDSNATVTYAMLSGPAVLSGNVVTITGAGKVTLQASQAAAGNYSGATATTTFQVNAAVPALTISNIGTQVVGSSPFAASASSTSQGAMSWSVSGPAVLNSNMITVQGPGTVTVSVSQAADGNYAPATASTTFVAQDFQLTVPSAITVQAGVPYSTNLVVSGFQGFTGTVSVSCSLPSTITKASCSTTNAQLTASSAQSATTLTIMTVKEFTSASNNKSPHFSGRVLFFAMLAPLGLFWRRKRIVQLALILFAFSLLGMTGCGTGIAPGTAPGTYNLTLTMKSGAASHITTIPLVIQ